MSSTETVSPGFANPVTFEVFRHALTGIADEMGLVMLRTSHSPTLTKAMDFSTAICDADGRVVAQGNCMMIHLGTFPDVTKAVLARYDTFSPGDVFIFNEEKEVAQHLPDLYAIRPYFVDGVHVGFGVCSAHHTDIGGQAAGGMDIKAAEIFAEGLQIPLVQLDVAGERQEDIMRILRQNVRSPELLVGDLEGQLAALRVGELNLQELVRRHSLQGYRQLSQELLDYTERLTRAEIEALPDGEYTFEDWLDDDGRGKEPIRLCVTVRVNGDQVEIDWDGTGPQADSAINCHVTNTRSISYGALQSIFAGELPSNDGLYRPVRVVAPEGSIANAVRPAARGVRGMTLYRLIDTLLGALAKIRPDLVPACSDGGAALVLMWGVRDDEGRPMVRQIGPFVSGWGARHGQDANEHVSPLGANFASVPVEVMEEEGVIRVDRQCLVTDSEGPGTWRGCLAVRTDIRFLKDVTMQWQSPHRDVLAYGLAEGGPGSPSSDVLVTPDAARPLAIHEVAQARSGDVVRHTHASGGGWGDPFARAPERVLADVVAGKVSVARAAEVYGVHIDPATLQIDQVKTRELRTG